MPDKNRKLREEGPPENKPERLDRRGPPSGVLPNTPTLERWSFEVEMHHRALLLWAMQHPGDNPMISRSKLAVSRAMGVTSVAVTHWSQKKLWQLRVEAYVDAELAAFQLYQKLYMKKYGKLEIPHVADRMIVPIVWTESLDLRDGITSNDAIALAKAKAQDVMSLEQQAIAGIQERRRKEKEKVEGFRSLIDMSLLEAGRLLKERRLQLSAKDIKPLLEARQELANWLATQDERQLEQRAGVESARMKHARDTGGDLVEAMWQDLLEIQTILSALRTTRDSQTEMVSQSYAELKRQAENAEPLPTQPEVIDVIEAE
jgi:hypothetical protein